MIQQYKKLNQKATLLMAQHFLIEIFFKKEHSFDIARLHISGNNGVLSV